MDIQTYDRYRDALEAAKDMDDKETLEKIKSRLVADYGPGEDDVETLFKYHT